MHTDLAGAVVLCYVLLVLCQDALTHYESKKGIEKAVVSMNTLGATARLPHKTALSFSLLDVNLGRILLAYNNTSTDGCAHPVCTQ